MNKIKKSIIKLQNKLKNRTLIHEISSKNYAGEFEKYISHEFISYFVNRAQPKEEFKAKITWNGVQTTHNEERTRYSDYSRQLQYAFPPGKGSSLNGLVNVYVFESEKNYKIYVDFKSFGLEPKTSLTTESRNKTRSKGLISFMYEKNNIYCWNADGYAVKKLELKSKGDFFESVRNADWEKGIEALLDE